MHFVHGQQKDIVAVLFICMDIFHLSAPLEKNVFRRSFLTEDFLMQRFVVV